MDIKVLASGSKGNAYLISDGVTQILLECGISIKRIRKGLDFRLSEVKACLVTHEHGDHSKAITDVLRAGIDIYTSPGTIGALGLENHRLRPVKDKQSFEVGTWQVIAFDTQHDAKEPLGFLLHSKATSERLVFATDTYYVRYKFPRLTHVMIECNYASDILQANVDAGLVHPAMRKRLLTSHFSLDNVKEFLKANDLSQVREIWLLHLSDGNSDAERFKKEIMELTGKPTFIAG
ncbi:MAG: MBL fold metallo-hydrolase [Bacillota bacterium]|nr:MBL fold metallo-hydrolase [Bacillota bacterium]